ncbi:lipid II flippase MurJ [Actinomyces sp. W5033]|uniref:murein biosynthesis integral membrane protein MurJ n=1 Tax=Actinomyces sp. W5033 TaxID=3446479 RepID=UPI003EE14355
MSTQRSIARSSAVMAAGTLASRLLGLVRNALLIAALGATASGAADAFNVANMLPTQLYNLIIGGVLNAILVPQIVRVMRERNGDELVNRLLTAAAAIIAALAALLTIAAPLVVTLYASGLDRWQPLAYAFAFWCMPQVFFYGLYALWGQVLNARHNFGPYMWAPVLNNIVSIIAILAYLRLYGSYTQGQDPGVWDAGRIALVGGTTTLGIALQALVLYVPLRRSGFRPRLVWGLKGTGLGTMSKVALWALVGTAVSSLGDLAVTNLGSRAVTAAESAQYAGVIVPSTTMYANALLVYMLPQSLVTASVITALFTRMSEKAAAGDRDGVRDDLSLGLRSVGVFTVLFAVGIATLSAPALQLFVPSLSLAQATASAPILTVLALGIPLQGIWFTTQRVMLAYADTRRLVRADSVVGGVGALGCVLAYLLAPADQWMMWAAVANVASLAAASAAIVPLLRRHLPSLDGRRVASTYARLVGAALAAFVVGWGVRQLLGPTDGSLTGTRATDALLTVLLAAVLMTLTYLAAARVARVTELGVLFGPVSRLVLAVGGLLPGGAGRGLQRLGRALALPAAGAAAPSPAGADGPSPAGPAAPSPGRAAAASQRASQPGAHADRLSAHASTASEHTHTEGGPTVVAAGRPSSAGGTPQGTPIGTGRYRLLGTLPTTLPHVVRHAGRDTILDRDVTVLALTAATRNRQEVLSTAARAVLVDDPRTQRVLDVEHTDPGHIITEPASGRTLRALVETGLRPEQVRAIIGEAAEALDACSRRGLHHLSLSPESVRLRPDGTVQLSGIGIEAALLGLDDAGEDPLAADRRDAHALVELLYYGLTGRWPGKRAGIVAAPVHAGAPVAPSTLVPAVADQPDLDALVARTWGGPPPQSAAEVAHALRPWDTSVLPVVEAAAPATPLGAGPDSPTPAPAATSSLQTARAAVTRSLARTASQAAAGAAGLLARLKALSASRGVPPASALPPAEGPDVVGAGPVAHGVQAAALGDEGSTVSLSTLAPQLVHEAGTADTGHHHDPQAPEDWSTWPAAGASAARDTAPAGAPAVGAPAAQEPEQARGPRLSLTTAAVMALALVAVVVGVYLAVNNLLQLGRVPIADEDVPAARTVPTAMTTEEQVEPSAPIVISGAESLDPYDDRNEHPELVGNLIDGDPSTEWYSRFYAASSLAWKQGIGVAVRLETATQVSSIELQGTGTGGNVQIRATSPEDPTGGTLLAQGPMTAGTTTFTFPATSTGSVVVWVTDLPTASDGLFKVTITEITLR